MMNFSSVMKCEKWIDQHNTSMRILRSHFNTKLKIHHLQLFIYHTHDDFDSADPNSMQDACHISTQLNDLALHELL